MAAPPLAEDPPPYTEEDGAGPDEMLNPAVFVLHGRFVYSAGPSGVTESEPLYQLSRTIHSPGRKAEPIEIERLERRVRTGPDGSPRVSTRVRSLYELRYSQPLFYAGVPAEGRLVPQSNKTVGGVRITKSPLFHRGYRALRVMSEDEKRRLEVQRKRQGMKVKDESEQYHFVIKGIGGDHAWRWSDPNGRFVADQLHESAFTGSGLTDIGGVEPELKLKVLVSLPRRTLDSLVAMWCLWLWYWHLEENRPKRTWEDHKRILQQPRMLTSPHLG